MQPREVPCRGLRRLQDKRGSARAHLPTGLQPDGSRDQMMQGRHKLPPPISTRKTGSTNVSAINVSRLKPIVSSSTSLAVISGFLGNPPWSPLPEAARFSTLRHGQPSRLHRPNSHGPLQRPAMNPEPVQAFVRRTLSANRSDGIVRWLVRSLTWPRHKT